MINRILVLALVGSKFLFFLRLVMAARSSAKRYKKLAFLGEGQFATVFSATDLEDPERKTVAIKKIKLARNVRTEGRDGINRTAIREIKFLKEVKHKNICALLDVFGRPGSSISLVFEFMQTDLHNIITKTDKYILTPANIKCFILQTLIGIDWDKVRKILEWFIGKLMALYN